ncbi:hypothetical protein [Nocardia abscessus]|nr:hypothetical protein [Nocardia abscessus]
MPGFRRRAAEHRYCWSHGDEDQIVPFAAAGAETATFYREHC